MTRGLSDRVKVYKKYLRLLIAAHRDTAYKMKLKMPTAREIGDWARTAAKGVAFSNVARDIREVTRPGERYDPEFDLLLRGQVVPEVIDSYSDKFLSNIIKNVITPEDLDEKLAAINLRPDGRRVWEPM